LWIQMRNSQTDIPTEQGPLRPFHPRGKAVIGDALAGILRCFASTLVRSSGRLLGIYEVERCCIDHSASVRRSSAYQTGRTATGSDRGRTGEVTKNTSRLSSLGPLKEAQIFNIGSQSAWQQAFPPPKIPERCIWPAISGWLRFSASSNTAIWS
jgi:hypothetical protein